MYFRIFNRVSISTCMLCVSISTCMFCVSISTCMFYVSISTCMLCVSISTCMLCMYMNWFIQQLTHQSQIKQPNTVIGAIMPHKKVFTLLAFIVFGSNRLWKVMVGKIGDSVPVVCIYMYVQKNNLIIIGIFCYFYNLFCVEV